MNFTFSEEQIAIQEMAKEFAEHELLPFAAEWDKNHFFPKETLIKAATLGLAAIYVKREIGGSGLTRLDSAIIFQALATACPSTAAYLSIHNMVAWLIDHYGDDELRQKYLPSLISFDHFASYCLTEPSSGSDAASLKTRAIREGDYYIVNGSKAFISGGSVSDIYVCMVRTGDEGPNGISCLLVEKNTPGLSFGNLEKKLGWHSQPTSMVFFEDCRIPIKNRIGNEGDGFKIALNALNGGRINIAACSLGGAKKSLQLTKDYLLTRKQFGKNLAQFQALQFRFADMLTLYEAAQLMIYRAADALDKKNEQAPLYAAMCKRYATDICFEICNEALQMHGGYGYMEEYQIERYFRDLRVHQILEGTNEIMRHIIAKQMLNENTELF